MATINIPEPKSLDQILSENPDLREKLDKKIDNVVLAQQAIRRDLDLTLYLAGFISVVVVVIYLKRHEIFKSSKFVPIQSASYHRVEDLQREMSKDYYLTNSAYNCGFRKCLKCKYLVGNKHELAQCPEGFVGDVAPNGETSNTRPNLHYLDMQMVVLKYSTSAHDFALTPQNNDKTCCKHCGIVISMDELKNGRCVRGIKRHESDGEIYDGKFMKVL
jgi:hypothetical protein